MLQSMRLLRVRYNLATEQQQSTKHRNRKFNRKLTRYKSSRLLSLNLFSSPPIWSSQRCQNTVGIQIWATLQISHYLWDKVPNPQYASYSCHRLVCRLPFTSLKALCSSLSQDICTCCSFCLKYFDTETIDLRLGLECMWLGLKPGQNPVWDLNPHGQDSNLAKTLFGIWTHMAGTTQLKLSLGL